MLLVIFTKIMRNGLVFQLMCWLYVDCWDILFIFKLLELQSTLVGDGEAIWGMCFFPLYTKVNWVSNLPFELASKKL